MPVRHENEGAAGRLILGSTQAKHVLALILIQFHGHGLPLSLAELAAQTGLRKSVLLRVLPAAVRLGYLVRDGAFEWRRTG
ncbi:helix-turn-helix domain-containing protein [Roseomonas elaeocarpi]|uniref:Helix-turn-helix domain-containing protein n=1 Tax=Roseomonas elaeocarpi TaxID=907779 RepID=A0ABV6JRC3_9PROT